MTTRPMNSAEKRAYNQRRHAETRQAHAAERGPQGLAELWWDQARKTARDGAARGDANAWNELAATLMHFCQRYSE
ncbi:hypothetical protein EDD27_1468 [Nonomuraea polychroma]|uniref:Uncharacterized protein n=1 Tax=Nonomuraea polychroma TaxID=46176 RepID=A0A438M000_9ACTN|nr:hypothetical protein [Nonomuraea polychroma]RVX39125.1 hypothetical protein EDD27_1468 [Nonomuraea polychroma]